MVQLEITFQSILILWTKIQYLSCLTMRAFISLYMDANQFRHILTSTKHKQQNKDLRDQIAISARKLAPKIVDPNS